MKKRSIALFALCAVALTALALVGCSRAPEPEVSAQDTVTAAIDEFKAGDVDDFYSYMNLTDKAKDEEADEDQVYSARVFGPKITYKVVSSKEDPEKGNATVKIEIMHPSMQAIYDRAVEMAKAEQLDSTQLTDEEAEAKSLELFEKAAQEAEATETSTVTVKLGLVEGPKEGTYVWKITDDSLYEPLFGGDIVTSSSAPAE